jgi:ribosomal protein L20A (L18A)
MKNLDYLAGFFDGEGWISGRYYIDKRYNTIHRSFQIGLANTNQESVKIFYDMFGGNWYEKQENVLHKKVCRWCIASKDQVEMFYSYIGSKLIVKREQMEIMINYFRNKETIGGKKMNPKDIELIHQTCNALRKLNVKGNNKYE